MTHSPLANLHRPSRAFAQMRSIFHGLTPVAKNLRPFGAEKQPAESVTHSEVHGAFVGPCEAAGTIGKRQCLNALHYRRLNFCRVELFRSACGWQLLGLCPRPQDFGGMAPVSNGERM